jgi:hypothetical protein
MRRPVAALRLSGPGQGRADAIALMKTGEITKKRGVPNPYGSHLPGGRAEIALREIFRVLAKSSSSA